MILYKELHKPLVKPDVIEWANGIVGKIWGFQAKLSYQQEQALREMVKPDSKIIIKAYRISGLTTLLLLSMAYKALYVKNNGNIFYISHDQKSASAVKNKFMKILDAAAEKAYVIEESQRRINIEHEGFSRVIKFYGANDETISGICGYDVYFDNAAFIQNGVNPRELINFDKNKSIIVGSCPKYNEGFFYNLWDTSFSGKDNTFTPISLNWYMDPLKNKDLCFTIYDFDISYRVPWNGNISTMAEYIRLGWGVDGSYRQEREKLTNNDSVCTEVDGFFVEKYKLYDDIAGEDRFY